MPGWNGSGQFVRVFSWVADALAGINITASRMDTDTDNITTNGFNNCLTRDGQGSATDDLPMNNFRHTGVGFASQPDEYAPVLQIQDNSFTFAVAAGAADALTAAFTPAITALVDGMQIYVRILSPNATATPTLKVDGTPLHRITKLGNQPVAIGDLVAGMEAEFRYNLANLRWELLNPVTTSGVAQTPWAVAAGAVDAITAAYTPAIATLTDGLLLGFRAFGANLTTTPTFSPNGLTPRTITKKGGAPLVAGDITAALSEYLVRYNLANTRWELMNPTGPSTPTVLLSGNVGTGSVAALAIDFSSFTGFNRFELSIDNLVASSSAVGVIVRYSINAGASFITTGTYNNSIVDFLASYTYAESAAATNIPIGNPLLSASVWSFIINLTGINKAMATLLQSEAVYYNGAETRKASATGSNTTNSINAVTVFLSSGTVTSGTYRLVGYP